MPRRIVRLPAHLLALRAELELPGEFPPAALEEAERAARAPRLPAEDLTDVEFVTIDPPGSRDLDQALHIARRDGGFRVRYAIADVAAFVDPGGAIDVEAWARGVTLYAPDGNVPLHPPVLSEGAASLLADQERPALVWTIDLDGEGEPVATRLARARVRSRAQLDYAGVQAALDDGSASEPLRLLAEVGVLRQARERDRGGVHLALPQQEVDDDLVLRYRAELPVEGFNAQISLLTGMEAAKIMLAGGVGLLRTVPEASGKAVAALRRSAAALGVAWPEEMPYAEWVRGLDPTAPAHAALLTQATGVMRGAGYAAFDGAPPEHARHAAIAAPYAHVTAPLRRLADRYALEVCVALSSGTEIPAWARARLPELPTTMSAADRRAGSLERAVVDLMEAALLEPCVGREFDAVAVAEERVQLRDPPVVAPCEGELPVGEEVRVELLEADPAARVVRFALAAAPSAPAGA